MKQLLVIVIAIICSGCASRAPLGQGGWAENYLRHEDGNESVWYTESYSNLKRDLEHLRLRLELLRARGIVDCMPARLKLATLMTARVTRQLSANMYAQTEHDLGILYHQINLLQLHFEQVQSQTGCGRRGLSVNVSNNVQAAAQDLLNSDNQFAFTDENITPKYLLRIKQASELLKPFEQINLLLIGHTDAIGTSSSNLNLGLMRANKVKQALIDSGLEHANIQVVSHGEDQPYAEGKSLATRLSNRRVNAVIIALSAGDGHHEKADSNSLILKQWTHAVALQPEYPL